MGLTIQFFDIIGIYLRHYCSTSYSLPVFFPKFLITRTGCLHPALADKPYADTIESEVEETNKFVGGTLLVSSGYPYGRVG